jgi:hypothetical protein
MAGSHDYEFDRSIFAVVDDTRVSMNGPAVLACDIDVRDGKLYYFQVVGKLYRYGVNVVSEGGVEIVVIDHGGSWHSTICPTSQSELIEAINTIQTDHEPVFDGVEAVLNSWGCYTPEERLAAMGDAMKYVATALSF